VEVKIKFNKINHIILFGGSRLTAEIAQHILKDRLYSFSIYTCDRQLNDAIYDGETLGDFLKDRNINYTSTDDINTAPGLLSEITENSFGLGLGEAWSFSKEIIEAFGGRLLDIMGIRLPQYRGGAHYTWQILRKNKIGGCNLQVINEDMIQGVFDSGEIIKSREYFFPAEARTPDDYFEIAVKQEIDFIKEFLDEVKNDQVFELGRIQENFSMYFPRMNTLKHGIIDWSWDTNDIENFICAFDEPYAGATTFIDGKKVHLKDCYSEFNEGPFHPFQAGLIYKIYSDAVFIATRSGTLIVRRVSDVNGKNIIGKLRTGQRFFTPIKYLEKAMTTSVEYSSEGIIEKNKNY